MPIRDATTIGVSQDLAERIREVAKIEDRQIVITVERMIDYYEPLTLMDHAIINQLARELDIAPGFALSHIIQEYAATKRSREGEPCPT